MARITDLAVELCEDIDHSSLGVTLDIEESNGVKKTITHITNARGAKKIGKPIGIYCNIEVKGVVSDKNFDSLSAVLGETISKFIEASSVDARKLLVVGLGNSNFVADSLGPKTCESIIPSDKLVTFTPNVIGATGIPSTEAIRAIVGAVRPSHVLVVDTLCCHDKERLGNNFQVSDTGITPGSGVGRNNQKIDAEFLSVPVIACGIPLVIYQPSLHYVVPKAIDMIVVACAQVIAGAVSGVVG